MATAAGKILFIETLSIASVIVLRFKSLVAKYSLRVITMVFTDGPVAPGEGLVFGGPYPGFTTPSQPGETDKATLVETHLKVFQEQVVAAQEFSPTLINCHAIKVCMS